MEPDGTWSIVANYLDTVATLVILAKATTIIISATYIIDHGVNYGNLYNQLPFDANHD